MNKNDRIPGMDERVEALGNDAKLARTTLDWIIQSGRHGYGYNFAWLGRPIIQLPQDMVGLQELIWQISPDLIIEAGIARGGSLIFSASMLALLDMSEAITKRLPLYPAVSQRKVIGIDIDIRSHNLEAIEKHPMISRIKMIQGSSIDPSVVKQVHKIASDYNNIMVLLDSMHTHDHVLAELEAYAPLVTRGSYCVVYDTVVEYLPDDLCADRPWGKGNNPKSAVHEFLGTHPEFSIDTLMHSKLLITTCPDGFLKRI